GTFEFEKGDKRSMEDFNVFYRYHATYPFYSDGIWFLTQMRRWGQIPESKPATWYEETIKDIYRPDLWEDAATELVAEGKIPASDIPDTDGYKAPTADFIDGTTYDGKDPIGYINSFKIGNKDK
ncbi:MAG: nitrate ABC transporter substrate-binding protein, partial [Bacteroidota bacterium]